MKRQRAARRAQQARGDVDAEGLVRNGDFELTGYDAGCARPKSIDKGPTRAG
jgi:hypothetical protein